MNVQKTKENGENRIKNLENKEVKTGRKRFEKTISDAKKNEQKEEKKKRWNTEKKEKRTKIKETEEKQFDKSTKWRTAERQT